MKKAFQPCLSVSLLVSTQTRCFVFNKLEQIHKVRTGPHQWRGQTQRLRVRACWNSTATEPKSVDHLDQPRCSFRRRYKAAAPTSRTRCHFCCGRSNGRDLAAYPAVEAAGADRFFIVPHHAAALFLLGAQQHNNRTRRSPNNTKHARKHHGDAKGVMYIDVFDIQGYCRSSALCGVCTNANMWCPWCIRRLL